MDARGAVNILLVSDVSMTTILGGAERILYEHSTRLQAQGHHVVVLSRKVSDACSKTMTISGVQVIHFEVDRRNPFAFLVSSLWNAAQAYRQIAREITFDLVCFHQPLSAMGVTLVSKRTRLPATYTFQSPAFLEYQMRHPTRRSLEFARAIHFNLLRWIERHCLQRCHKIVVMSHYMKELVQQHHAVPEERISIVPGGVDLQRFTPAQHRGALRRWLKLPEKGCLLLTIRNLEARMGLPNLLEAMKLLNPEAEEISLIIGGSGSQREALQELKSRLGLEGRVEFRGQIPEDELAGYYQASDFFILPTRELEGFGLVTVEALACGTPVLGTPVGGTPEILRPLRSDLLFPGTDPDAIAKVILEHRHRLRSDPDGYQDLRDACRRHALDRYAWAPLIKALEAVLLKAAES